MLIQSLLNSSNQKSQGMRYADFLSGNTPLFSQFGRNIYASDVVQTCIDRIATECSKLQPKHIRRDKTGKIVPLPGDNLNSLFRVAPNELMTTRDFLEKIIWQLFLNYNAFIYPTYYIYTDAMGRQMAVYTGFYPLDVQMVEFLQDEAGTVFIRMTFANGRNYTLPYSEVIHIRKKYSVNDVMGGGLNGQPDNAALLKTLEINDTLLQGLGKAIKTSLSIKGLLKINGVLAEDKKKAEREAFENQLLNSESGIVPMDVKSEYSPVTLDPKMVDSATLQVIENKILRWYGMSLPILNNSFTDDEYQAFYNSTLEPIVIGLGQAFSKCLFTQTQLAYGNEIIFYNHRLEMMDVKNKLAIMDGLGNRGALSNNELLALFGLEPYDGGDVHMASLNFINSALADSYQLARAGIDGQTPNTKQGGE